MTDIAPAPACVLAIFGAGGDLTKRLLLPSIYNLITAKVLPDSFRLLGIDKHDFDEAKFRDYIAKELKEFWSQDVDPAAVEWLTSRAFYQTADFSDAQSFDGVTSAISRVEKDGNRLFYLAVGPDFIASIAKQLSERGLLSEESGRWSRLIVEKPFGNDLASGIALNRDLEKLVADEQIYRIDHFAGKDAVQDLAVFRFANSFVEPIWNSSNVESVQITAAETVGLEGRAGYYDKTGALRDMVPNHLMENLSLTAMEPPQAYNARYLRDRQTEVLRSVRKMSDEDVSKYAVRGQYEGYRQEKGADPNSNAESYVALQLQIDNDRWIGVPFYLRTGKRLAKSVTEVVVTFRRPLAHLFPGRLHSVSDCNRWIFTLTGEPGIKWIFNSKSPGLKLELESSDMHFRFPPGPFGKHEEGYERLLHDAMTGEQLLFQRADFTEEGWRIVQPIIERWSAQPAGEFPNYAAGSKGPVAADRLLSANGHGWHSPEE